MRTMALVIIVAGGLLAVRGEGGGTSSHPQRAAASGCPSRLLPLGPNPIAAAARVALRGEREADKPRVRAASIASTGQNRGRHVKTMCGDSVARRSVTVDIKRRVYNSGPNNSASLSQSVVVVGRFKSGWRVWTRLH
jgi:hypothetical protein